MPLPSSERLHQVFVITDGRLINKISITSRKAGAFADNSKRRFGYRTVYVDGALRYAHRVIWKMTHGSDPDSIDHVDGNLANNRPDNLREATHSQNMMNAKLHASNTSGAKGVSLQKDHGMWRAYISLNRRSIRLGQFSTFNEAKLAVDLARTQLHGEFARKL
jgi:hypothetical protein